MATKSQKKAPSGTSLALFKAWLSGIEEMQGEDWTPNAEQWKRIKEKLMAIEEAPTTAPAPEYTPPRQYAPAPYIPQPSAFEQPQRLPAPPQPFGHQPSARTPDIDSSNGYVTDLV